MTTELTDITLVSELFAHYAPFLADRMRSPVTGGPLAMPSDLEQQANLLDFALYEPDAVVVWTRTLSTAQLALWQPYLDASRYKFAISCANNKGRSQEAMNLGPLPIYEGVRGFAFRSFLHAGSRLGGLFYPGNTHLNQGYMRRSPHLMHVHIGHGDSDKHASANRVNVSYDFIMLANQAAIDRYRRNAVEIEPTRFLTIGASVVPGVVPRLEPGPLVNVLYAPTFEGRTANVNFSSVGRAYNAMTAFAAAAPERLHCRMHPALGAREKPLLKLGRKLVKRQRADGAMTKAGAFNWSDVIVCDISGVQSEYLFTGKPIVIPVSDAGGGWIADYVRGTGLGRFAYLWDHHAIGLDAFLDSIADDPLREARLNRRRALFLGAESFEGSVAMFDDAIGYVLESRKMRHRRQQTEAGPRYVPPPLPPHPDAGIDRLVDEIRAGKVMLRSETAPEPESDTTDAKETAEMLED